MSALEEARKAWLGKTDEWLYERLNKELKQKLEEIHRLLKESEMCEADSNAALGEVPKCEQERYWFGEILFQRLYFTGHWYAIHNGIIVDHDQYRYDLEERLRHLA